MFSNEKGGAIGWMAKNSVAANLLMSILIIGGLMVGPTLKQEVFPDFDLDMVRISVPYPGASPAEVEQSVILAVEEAVRGLDGVDKVTSTASEGNGLVIVELLRGTESNKALQDIKSAVDRITSIPEEAERPTVSLLAARREVITVVVYGDGDEHALRALVEQVRDDLLANPNITYVELSGVRNYEISIEVPQEVLRTYGLTLDDVAREVRKTAIELPGGGIKTNRGEILLRTMERRDLGIEFADVPIVSGRDGSEVLLGDIATIVDGFADTDVATYFNGKPAAMVKVFRVGDQTPIKLAAEVKKYVASLNARLPKGMAAETWRDWSEIYYDRISLLLRNAALGLILVLIVLGTFLEIRLAFWVTMGIPVSIIGAALIMPLFGVSFNMISLFAFILTLGIVVDDAIVVGENIYEMRKRNDNYLDAAIEGAKNVAVPVTFSVLTNIAAFFPLFFVPGVMGKLFGIMPAIIVPVFAISLIESLFVLPAHLGHQKEESSFFLFAILNWITNHVEIALEWFIKTIYRPIQRLCLNFRYVTVSFGLAVLLIIVGCIASGRIEFRFMPKVEGDQSMASIELAYGVPVEDTARVTKHILSCAQKILDEYGEGHSRGILAQVGVPPMQGGPGRAAGVDQDGSHLASIMVYFVPIDKRPFTAVEFTNKWRKCVGAIPGLELLTFKYNIGPSAGSPIDVQLIHHDVPTLERAAEDLGRRLEKYNGIRDIDDGFSLGKPQLNFKLKPAARALGLRADDLGRQVRNSFYGAEALRQQRGRNELKVMVRLPTNERRAEYYLEELLIRTPQGGELPLFEAASIERGRAYTQIKRDDGRRVLNVTADVIEGAGSSQKILADLTSTVLPELMKKYRGLTYSFEGEQRDQRKSFQALGYGFLFVLIVIYAMLAIPFGSYVQPIVIMVSIPFGIVGAVLGHALMGYELSMISMMGIVALAGVVVNDSLVLIDAANQFHREGNVPFEAISSAGQRRFRPILLTSLTTFFGLMPMIFETSVQARFLVPMAISLGYGILFATIITLLLVPAFYLIVEDLRALFTYVGILDEEETYD